MESNESAWHSAPRTQRRDPNCRRQKLTCALLLADESLINRLSSSALAPNTAAPLLPRFP